MAGSSKWPKHHASVYVGNLPPTVTEAVLLEKFSAVGAVCSIRICRDKATNRFLGYAYVNFRRKEDATQALVTMNGRLVGGRPIRVMWPERNGSTQSAEQAATKPGQDKKKVAQRGTSTIAAGGSQKNPVGIFITGLSTSIIEKNDLREFFSSFGSIVDCGVGLDDEGRSKGFGFVQFKTEETAEECAKKTHGCLLNTSRLSVTKLYTNVHVFNFGYRLNFGSMRELFGQYGAISVYRVVKNDGKSNGFGYVTFKQLKSAAHAIAELNGKDLGDGLKLKVESAPCPTSDHEMPNEGSNDGVNLYIKIRETSVTNDRLRELFSAFGPIISVKVLKGQSKDGQRAGLVRFALEQDATEAIAEMNGKVVGTGPLSVALAILKPESKSPKNVKSTEPLIKQSIPKSNLTADQKKQSPEEKRALAERLYLQVKQLNASMAGAISDRLVELDNLQSLITQPTALKAKVDETVVAILLGREQHLQRIQDAPANSAAA